MKPTWTAGIMLAVDLIVLSACGDSEAIRKNDEIIRQQEEELKSLREEEAARKKEEHKRQTCAIAFRNFEKAQAVREPGDAVAFYREGLKLCPDDDVAHYELGKILAGMGRNGEAREEFEAALKINPNFQGAKQELEKIQNR